MIVGVMCKAASNMIVRLEAMLILPVASADAKMKLSHHNTIASWQCSIRGAREHRTSQGSQLESDGQDDQGIGNLVCNVAGPQWEQLRFPVVVDSGVCVSVEPAAWCEHSPSLKIPQSEAGEFFRSAGGQTIHNHCQRASAKDDKRGQRT